MTRDDQAVGQTMMTTALAQLQKAIELLDQAEAPGQIAAHVDLAVHQLAEALGIDLSTRQNSRGSSDFETPATSCASQWR